MHFRSGKALNVMAVSAWRQMFHYIMIPWCSRSPWHFYVAQLCSGYRLNLSMIDQGFAQRIDGLVKKDVTPVH